MNHSGPPEVNTDFLVEFRKMKEEIPRLKLLYADSRIECDKLQRRTQALEMEKEELERRVRELEHNAEEMRELQQLQDAASAFTAKLLEALEVKVDPRRCELDRSPTHLQSRVMGKLTEKLVKAKEEKEELVKYRAMAEDWGFRNLLDLSETTKAQFKAVLQQMMGLINKAVDNGDVIQPLTIRDIKQEIGVDANAARFLSPPAAAPRVDEEETPAKKTRADMSKAKRSR